MDWPVVVMTEPLSNPIIRGSSKTDENHHWPKKRQNPRVPPEIPPQIEEKPYDLLMPLTDF